MPYLRERFKKDASGKKKLVGIAAVFYDPDRHPKEKYVSLHTTNRSIARRKLVKLEDQMEKGWDPWASPKPNHQMPLGSAITDYLAAKTGIRPKSLRADKSLLRMFENQLPPNIPVSSVERRHVDSFLNRDISSSTKRTYLTRLSTFFDWCVASSLGKTNPVKEIQPPKAYRKEKPFLKEAEVERLVRAIEAESVIRGSQLKTGEIIWLTDVIYVAVGTGMRLGELCALKWSGVDLDHGMITVKVSEDFKTKNGHERSIPVRGKALDVLQKLHSEREAELDGYVLRSRRGRSGDRRGLNPEYVSRRFKHFAKLAKLPPDTTFHTLRHTYVTWMLSKGVAVHVVQKLAGHSDIRTTMLYAHHCPDGLSAAVELVFA